MFISRAYRWFSEIHHISGSETLNYFKPYSIDSFLKKLPLDMPRSEVVDKMTEYCFQQGGDIVPISQQRQYLVNNHLPQHLYIIGNGFDRYHKAESNYKNFRHYLMRHAPNVLSTFDLYFGPKSLERSFKEPTGYWWCQQPKDTRKYYGIPYPETTWAEDHLWNEFEKYLGDLNREKIFDILDMRLPTMNEGEKGFKYADYYAPLNEITEAVELCTFEMKYQFHRWINTLHYQRGFRKRMLPLDPSAIYLNFNYTIFLESEYKIPANQILYIHGCRKDKFGNLIIGHNDDDEKSFNRWIHKNENRRRYRPNLKDKRGNYFANDKLAYLTFFLKDETKGNWRLPIRYHAVENAEERLEGYYRKNFKNTAAIIDRHRGFFSSLSDIKKITVIGHSLSDVDMPYLKQIANSLKDRKSTHWEFSYHTEKDKEFIERFCKKMKIDSSRQTKFEL